MNASLYVTKHLDDETAPLKQSGVPLDKQEYSTTYHEHRSGILLTGVYLSPK